jgi:hypothetical protein
VTDAESDEIPAELRALMDAEIGIEDLDTPAIEQKAREVLARLPGIEEPRRAGKLLTLRYDVENVTKAEIRAALERAGLRVVDVLAAPDSPVGDAVHG